MKRYLGKIFALMVALTAIACEESSVEGPAGGKNLFVEMTSKSLEAKGGSFVILVESDTDWKVGINTDWLSVAQSNFSGSAGVLFTYTANEQAKSRNAIVTIAPAVEGTANSYSVMVIQKGTSSDDNTGGNTDGSDDNTGGDNTGGSGDNTGGDNTGGDNTGGSGDNTGGGNTGGGNTGGGLVTNGGTPHAGWAELPAEEDNSDYHYAYHMIPDKGNGKVRNFAVCYSEELGCPVWVASPMHYYYTAKNTSRSDAYAPDPEIPSSIQVHKRSGYTRGHLLGSSDRLVSRGANEQAFYYSNIAPQLSSGFNTGGGVWNNLESYCDDQLCADTLYMVNGCYWENYNTKSSGTVIPTHYYKVLLRTKKGNSGKWVVNCSASELKCVVFMVAHNSNQHQVDPHRGMMMSVAELERMTGHTFFPNVPNAPKDSYNPSDWGL